MPLGIGMREGSSWECALPLANVCASVEGACPGHRSGGLLARYPKSIGEASPPKKLDSRASGAASLKRRVLRDLERGGLITVERPPRKTPIVTLVGL